MENTEAETKTRYQSSFTMMHFALRQEEYPEDILINKFKFLKQFIP